MSKFQIKSIFEQITPIVFKATDVNTARISILEFLDSKNINQNDDRLIRSNVEGCKTLSRLQQYICNSLLKYEGMGVK